MGYTDFDRECQSEWNIRMYSDIAYMLIKRCKKLKPDVFEKDDLVVLDAGCGAGGLSFGLLEHIHISKLYLVDLREDGLTIAKNRIFNSYPGIVINKIVADVQSVPLSDESVDLIISRGSIRFWDDQLKSLVELRRLLKSGGIMYVGGGRGSVDFQKERSQKDPNWSESSYSEAFKSGKKLGSKMLDDSEYVKLFDTWSDTYAIYNGLGDGHWLSVMKS